MKQTKIRCRIFAFALVTLVPVGVLAETLLEAMAWAYADNPDLNASRAGVRQSLENAHIANAAARPQINFSANLGRNYAEYAGNWQSNDQLSATVSASLLVYDGGNTGLATDAALARTRASHLQLLAQEQQILLNTAGAYLNVLRDRNLVSSTQNNINVLNSRLSTTRVAYDAGAATITDISQTEAAVAQAQGDLANARANLAQSEASYKLLTGRTPGSLVPVASSLPSVPNSLDEAIRVGNAGSPLILASIENERAAQFDLRRAQNARMPQVKLNASATRDNPLDGSDYSDQASVGVNVAIPLYNGGQISANQRQAQAALEARASETSSTRGQVRQNVTNAWAQIQNTNSAVIAMQQVVRARDLANQSAEVEYEIGALTITDRLEAEQNLISAQTSLVNAQYQQQFAVFQLLASMGQLSIAGMGINIVEINPIASPAQKKPETEEGKAVEKISDRWTRPDP